MLLRSAGFPIELVLKLSSVEFAAAADRLLTAERELADLQESTLAVVDQALKTERLGQPQSSSQRIRSLLKMRRALVRGRAVSGALTESVAAPAVGDAIAAYNAAHLDLAAVRTAWSQAHRKAVEQQSEEIYRRVREERFQEAVIWQSRSGFNTGVGKLAEKPPTTARNSSGRRKEALVASYLQRYCAKNDTIGFFGPSAWIQLVDAGPSSTRGQAPA